MRVATIKTVERDIRKLEGFDVSILHERDLRDVRSDRRGLPRYTYVRAAREGFSIHDWIRVRFSRRYPGFKVKVLGRNGKGTNGRTLLRNLRAQYGTNTSGP